MRSTSTCRLRCSAGAILASPFILFQVWLFIAPGLYQKERRFVVPFMAATVGLFLTGASFGYFFVLPGAIKILIVDFGHNFTPMVTIEDYTSFFLSIILGLGISFEMPILIFFLAMFGIVSPKFLWKNIRYAILAVFLVAAIITPSPDPWTMCIYAVPMLVALPHRHRRGLVGPPLAPQGQGSQESRTIILPSLGDFLSRVLQNITARVAQ